MSSTLNDRIVSLVWQLNPFNTLNPPNGCWIENSDGGMAYDPDNRGGADWCADCVEDVAMRLNLYTPGSLTYEPVWNDPCGNHDTLPACASCGKTLAGWPTDYCLLDELAYFEDDPDFDPTPEAIHIVSMELWNLQWSSDKESAHWRTIGESLLVKIAGQIEITAGASEP